MELFRESFLVLKSGDIGPWKDSFEIILREIGPQALLESNL
jgi:hypothetical protein